MKYTLLLFVFLLGKFAFGQEIRISETVKNIVAEIAEDDTYTSKTKAWIGGMTEQWSRYEKLKRNASEEELIKLTDSESSAVKAYAFKALVERENRNTFKILSRHLSDQQEIWTAEGCVVRRMPISDFFLENVTLDLKELRGYRLSESQKNALFDLNSFNTDKSFEQHSEIFRTIIDSLALMDENLVYPHSAELMKRIEPKEIYYYRIKELFKKISERECFTAIAKYKKTEDIAFLISGLEAKNVHTKLAAINAIKYFPDQAFFPYLEKIYKEETSDSRALHSYQARGLYLTLVQYKDAKSKAILTGILKNPNKEIVAYHSGLIREVLNVYSDPVYFDVEEILNKLDAEKVNDGNWK